MDIRVGNGFDAHKLVKGRKLILGNVIIPNETGLLGHSDADCLIHAICDSLFGAAGLLDIGSYFPDTDDSFKGISSIILLKEAGEIIRKNGFNIVNIDSVIICQKPKLAPFISQMKNNMAEALQIESDRIGVKATTTEYMGFTGRSEGIAALASALLSSGRT